MTIGKQHPSDSWDNRSTQSEGLFLNPETHSFFYPREVPLQMTMIWWIRGKLKETEEVREGTDRGEGGVARHHKTRVK